jgi:hypothetical protein
MTIYLVIVAIYRITNWFSGVNDVLNGKLMFGVACFGVLVNIILSIVFTEEHGVFHNHDHDHKHEHNIHKNDYYHLDDAIENASDTSIEFTIMLLIYILSLYLYNKNIVVYILNLMFCISYLFMYNNIILTF